MPINKRIVKILTGMAGAGLVSAFFILVYIVKLSQQQVIFPLDYPWVSESNKNSYAWSLESSTNLADWITVTNYPPGYTNDVWVTNDWSPMKFFRMHGTLH